MPSHSGQERDVRIFLVVRQFLCMLAFAHWLPNSWPQGPWDRHCIVSPTSWVGTTGKKNNHTIQNAGSCFHLFPRTIYSHGHPVHPKQQSLCMGQTEHDSVHLTNTAARRTGKWSRNEERIVEYHFLFFFFLKNILQYGLSCFTTST